METYAICHPQQNYRKLFFQPNLLGVEGRGVLKVVGIRVGPLVVGGHSARPVVSIEAPLLPSISGVWGR